jgi:predicted ATPase
LKDTLSSAKTLTTTIKAAHNSLTVLKEELNASKDSLKDEFAETSRELVKALEAQGVTSIQPDDYLNLTNRKAVLEDSVEELTQKTSSIEARKAELLKALEQLNSAWHEEFRLISGELSTINAAQSSLQVDSSFKGDKKGLADLMENTFRGHNIRRDTYKSLADSYMDCAEIYKNLDLAATEAKSKSETFKEQFLGNLYELLRYQVPNTYNVTYHGKPLKSHSLGQRASAMMLFILSQKENDLLLIDQPEDDLDNQTIYEEVVKLLRTIKPVQQFIFATHNANFPVLGDAELIASCHTNDNTILVETGSIDDKKCQEKIVNIMEGGPEAFNRRKTIYHLWRAG